MKNTDQGSVLFQFICVHPVHLCLGKFLCGRYWASRRDANILPSVEPRVGTHGYHRRVAARLAGNTPQTHSTIGTRQSKAMAAPGRSIARFSQSPGRPGSSAGVRVTAGNARWRVTSPGVGGTGTGRSYQGFDADVGDRAQGVRGAVAICAVFGHLGALSA